MRLQASSASLTAEHRAANDKHDGWTVALVLGALGVYAYLLTDLPRRLGLPTAREFLHTHLAHLAFREGSGAVDASIELAFVGHDSSGKLGILLAILAVAFVAGYSAELGRKKAYHVACSILALYFIYGPLVTAGFVAAHLLLYVTLHPAPQKALWAGIAAALFALGVDSPSVVSASSWALVAGTAGFAIYRAALVPLMRTRAAPAIRSIAVQSPLVVVLVGAAVQGLGGGEWQLPLGIVMFFWQWERLIFYHVDYKAGTLPSQVALVDYLAVFFTPAVLPKWQWGATLGQGYTYLDGGFYAKDKNLLARTGVKLLAIALLYVLFADTARMVLAQWIESLGAHAYGGRISAMVEPIPGGRAGHDAVRARYVAHRRRPVDGALRRRLSLQGGDLAGLRLPRRAVLRQTVSRHEPHRSMDALHVPLPGVLVAGVLLPRPSSKVPRFIRKNLKLRVIVATLAAATWGNLVWGHIAEAGFYHGLRWHELMKTLYWWPHFVALGVLITGTELYVMTIGDRRRQPWTGPPWAIAWDVVSVYLTWQVYGLIQIFLHISSPDKLPKIARLFLIGLGWS